MEDLRARMNQLETLVGGLMQAAEGQAMNGSFGNRHIDPSM
jgi:hypothetical protein